MAPSASRSLPAKVGLLPYASSGLYILVALVPVARLMTNSWTFGGSGPGLPWGDVCVLVGGMVAAAAAANAIAFAPSLAGATRAAATAHGAAALVTVAACAVLLAMMPIRQPLIGAETADSLGRAVYHRAVEPFFLVQLALGLIAALAFRALTHPLRPHRAAQAIDALPAQWEGGRTAAALAVACYLVVVACAHAGIRRDRWPSLDAPYDVRLAFVLHAIPFVMGSLAAAATARRIARSGFEAALRLAAGVHSIAAAASVLLMAAAWAVCGSTPRPAVLLSDLLLAALAGTTAGLLFWVVSWPWAGEPEGRTGEATGRVLAPVKAAGGPETVLAACGGAFLFFAAALVPVIGLVDRGWQPYRYSGWRPIPWADLVVLYVGTVAAAGAAIPAGRILAAGLALDLAVITHLAGALVTAIVSAFIIAPRLPPGVFQSGSAAMRGVPITAEELLGGVTPYVAVQFALGISVALFVRWWTNSSRLRRGSDVANPPSPASRWPRAALLAALAVACFLVFEAGPAMSVADRMIAGSMKRRHFDLTDERLRTGLATASIPVVLGILVAASSASAVARLRPGGAAALGAFLHFGAAVCVAPLAAPGFVARELAGLHPVQDAVIVGSHWFVGMYGAGIYYVLIPMVLGQTVIGALSALLFWVVARPWARAAG